MNGLAREPLLLLVVVGVLLVLLAGECPNDLGIVDGLSLVLAGDGPSTENEVELLGVLTKPLLDVLAGGGASTWDVTAGTGVCGGHANIFWEVPVGAGICTGAADSNKLLESLVGAGVCTADADPNKVWEVTVGAGVWPPGADPNKLWDVTARAGV